MQDVIYIGKSNDSQYCMEFVVVPPPSQMGGKQVVPFEIHISAADTAPHVLELYSARSQSIPHEGKEGKWSQLVPTWRFTDIDGNVITKIETIDTPIMGNGDSSVVGVTGFAKFYYIDDMPTAYRQSAVLWASLSMSGIPLIQESDDETVSLPSYTNSKVVAITPYEVNTLIPTQLNFTRNGLIPLSAGTYWKNHEVPSIVTVNGDTFKNFQSRAQLDARGNGIMYNFPFENDTVALSTTMTDASGVTGSFRDVNSSKEFPEDPTFKRYDSDDNMFRIGGYARCVGVYENNGASANVSGEINVSGDPNLAVSFCWFSAPNDNKVFRVSYPFVDENYVDDVSGWLGEGTTNHWNIKHDSFDTDPLTALLDYYSLTGVGGIYAIAVDPAYGVWMADGELSRLYKRDWTGNIVCSADLTSQLTGLLSGTDASAQFSNGEATPNNISIALDNTLYVSYFDSGLVTRHSGVDGSILGAAVFEGNTSVGGDVPIAHLDSTHKPVVVETAEDGTVWFIYARDSFCFANNHDASMGETPIRSINLPDFSYPFDAYCDSDGDLYITLTFHMDHSNETPGMLIVIRKGSDVFEPLVENVFEPSYIAVDKDRNVWFTSDDNTVNVWKSDSQTRYWLHCGDPASSTQPYTSAYSDVKQHYALEGIACDSNNRLWVINSPERKMYFYDVDAIWNISSDPSGYLGEVDPIITQTFEVSSYTTVVGDHRIPHTETRTRVVSTTETYEVIEDVVTHTIPVERVMTYEARGVELSGVSAVSAYFLSLGSTSSYDVTATCSGKKSPDATIVSGYNVDFSNSPVWRYTWPNFVAASSVSVPIFYENGDDSYFIKPDIDMRHGTTYTNTEISDLDERSLTNYLCYWGLENDPKRVEVELRKQQYPSAGGQLVSGGATLSRDSSKDLSVYRIKQNDMAEFDASLPHTVLLPDGISCAEKGVHNNGGTFAPTVFNYQIDTNNTAVSGKDMSIIYVEDLADVAYGGLFPSHMNFVHGTQTSQNVWTYTLSLNKTHDYSVGKRCLKFKCYAWNLLKDEQLDYSFTQRLFYNDFPASSLRGNDEYLSAYLPQDYSFLHPSDSLTGFNVTETVTSTETVTVTAEEEYEYTWYEDVEDIQHNIEVDNLTNMWARGDWSGTRFFRKYGQYNKAISGESGAFPIHDYEDYRIRKNDESWDITEVMKRYTTLDFQENESFFEDYVKGLVGGIDNSSEEVGRTLYERIANQTPNLHDIDECIVDALYSLSRESDVPIDDYLFAYPEAVRRIMDIVSIPRAKLWGDRCKCGENLVKNKKTSLCEKCNHYHESNLGPLIDDNYVVSAGIPYVIENKFRVGEYRIITPSIKSCIAAGGITSGETATASISGHTSLFVHGPDVDLFVHGPDVEWLNYCYYTYIPTRCNAQNTGVIQWGDTYTTLNESVSGVEDWYGENGIVEKLFNYLLHNGYGFNVSGYQY